MSSRNRWINRLAKRSIVASAAAAAASTLLSTSAMAVTGTWTTTSSAFFSSTGAWIFGVVPGGTQNIANFTAIDLSPGFIADPNNVQHLQVSLSTNTTLGSLVFADINPASPGDWQVLQGGGLGTLILDNGSDTPTINVGNLGNLATSSFALIDVPIIVTGTGKGMVKSGTGELRLTRSNDFGGGTISVNQGTLTIGTLDYIGNAKTTLSMGGGTLALRNNATFNMSGYQLNVTANSGLYIDRALNSVLTGQSIVDQIGTIALTGNGVRMTVGGSTNGYGLNIGTLIFQGGGSSFFTDVAPSLVTIGNVVSPSGGTLTFSGTGDASGSDILITQTISQTSTTALSIAYTDSHTLTVGSFGATAPTGALTVSGSGTLLVTGANAVIPSATLTISDGTLNFQNATVQSTVGTILMGSGGSSAAFIKMGTGGLKLTGPLTYSAGSSTNPSAPGLITATAGGVLTLSPVVAQTFNVGQITTTTGVPGRDVVIDIPIAATGSFTKSGAGELVSSGSNNITGTLQVNNGTFTSIARTTGSALGTNAASGTLIIQSGTFRLLSDNAGGGTASIGRMNFTGDTAPAKLVVDASGAGVGDATLSLGTFGTRVSGTGVLTIIPQKTTLNTNEHIHVGAFDAATDPANNHTILAPFVVTQKSGTNPALDFVSKNGSNDLVTATYTNLTGTETGGTAVAQVNGTATITGSASLFALRVDAGELVDGAGSLTLGDATRAGLILNDGAVISVSNLAFNAQEAVVWSGGTATGGTVNSPFTLSGAVNNLTTGGPLTLTFAGDIGFGGQSRTLTVGSGTTVVSGAISNGSVVKTGPGVLALINGSNSGFGGTLTVSAGTVSIGMGGDGSLGTGSANTGSTGAVGTLQFNLSSTRTITNFITGIGTVLQNSSTGGVLVLHTTAFSGNNSYTNLAILNGGVQLDSDNNIPQAATMTVSGGSFNLNGFNQTINALAGGVVNNVSTGLITNTSASVRTLTLNPASTITATYSGVIAGGANMRIVKIGTGTQQLAGNNDYTGGTTISFGTLTAGNNTALGHDASVVLNNANGAVLRLDPVNGVTIPASVSFSISNGTGTVSVGTISNGNNAGTISGPIVGIGTFVINNQNNGSQLTIGSTSLDTMYDANTLQGGTVLLLNGGLRFNSAAGANVGNPSINFNMSGTGVISTVATSTMRLGNIGATGGNNTTITAVAGSVIQLGAGGGAQAFGGTITGGGVTFAKVGTGTLTLNSRTSGYTGVTNILGGALALSNANLSGTPTINILGGPLVMVGAATISSTAAVNLSESFNFDLTTHQGWSTPSNVTVQGTGLIAGRYTHNAGTMTPGTDGGMGSIIFNSFDTRNTATFGDSTASAPGAAGVTLLDFTSLDAIGGGSNDLITINGDIGLNTNALFRVNNLNPLHNFTANETYPAILYSGSKLNGLNSTVSSAFRGSFTLVDVADNVNFPGYHVIGVKVVSFNTTPSVSTWTGSITSTWDLNINKNFVDANGTTTFFQGDSVVFNNSVLGPTPVASNKSINLANALILPGTLTFGNTSNLLSYTVQGGGTIGGGAKVFINGGGTVTFANNTNTYTGGTVVNSGWLMTGGNSGVLGLRGHFGVGSVLLNGGSSGQSATLVFAGNGNVINDLYTPTGQMANLQGLGSLGTEGKLNGTFNVVNSNGQRWDLRSSLQLPTDGATGTILINSNTTIRLMRPYSGAGLFFNFASGQGAVTTNLFDPMNDTVFLGGLTGPGSGNIFGFTGGNPAWYKAFVIGGANADGTWAGQVTDSFGRAPANGGGQNAAGISNSHGPTAITKAGTATLKLTGQSVVMSGDLIVNTGSMIIDSTDPFNGSREGGGLFVWATRVQVNSGSTFQMGSGGADGVGNYIGDNQSNTGTFLQASSTGMGVSWNANNATINVSKAYTSQGISLVTQSAGNVNLNSQYAVDPNLTISGSSGKIYGSTRVTGGTISPGDGGSGRFGTMTIYGVNNSAMENPLDPVDTNTNAYGESPALTLTGGALVFDVGTTTGSADNIVINNVGGTLGQFQIANNANNKVVVNFNGNSAAAGSKYTLMTYNSLNGTFQGGTGPQLVLNGRGATGTLVPNGSTSMQLSITTVASASNIEWSSSNGTWDVASWAPGATRNWANLDTASSSDYFYHGDNITFNPNAVAGGTVTIGGSVAPAKITVNTNLTGTDVVAYTFAGKGRITGNAVLVKEGNGTLTVRTKNDYSGGTTINAGTLEMGADPGSVYFPGMNISATGPWWDNNREGDLGTGTVTIQSGATLAYRATRGAHLTNNVVGGGNFIVDVLQGAVSVDTAGSWTGGTTVRVGYMRVGVDNAIPSTGSLNILTIVHPTVNTNVQGGAGGRFDLNQKNQSVNELYGNGAYSIVMNQGSLSLTTTSTFSVGSGNFQGSVHQGQEGNPQGTFAQIAVVKFGTGTLTMNYLAPSTSAGTLGTNITGLTDVKQGNFVLRGVHEPNGVPALSNVADGSYTIRNGAAFNGDGTARSTIVVETGGILAPGLPDSTVHAGGTLTINGLTLSSSILNFDLHGIDNDQVDIQVNNTLNVLSKSTVNITVDNTLVTQPGTYKLVDYRGTALQNFTNKFTLGSVTNPGIFSFSLLHNTSLTEVDLIVSQPTVTSTWNVATGGSWAVASNWSSVGTLTLAPNSLDSVANLTAPASMGVNPTITVDNTVALATLNLATANGHSFTVNKLSSGSFNFNTSGAAGVGINVTSGNHAINVPTTFNQDPTINVAGGSTLTLQQSLDAAGQNVTVTGGGSLVIGNIRNTSGFNGTANFRLTGSANVKIGHYVASNPVNGASKVNTISIDNGSRLDLTNNALVLDYSNPATGTALLSSTRALLVGGTPKIFSSEADATRALGYRDNQGTPMNVKDPSVSSNAYRSLGSVVDQAGAGGVAIDTTSIIIKYTYKGDTNLDGMVDINDLTNLATHFNQTPPGGDGWLWQQGDFNYDGTVNTTDLQSLGTNWLQGTGSIPNTQLSPLLAALGLPNVAVPEPTSLGLVGIGLTGLMARRRRRQS